MPAWLQIAGAVSSAILSYYTSYDDSKVREMIKDVAYNLNLALQKIDDISEDIDKLFIEVRKLPDEFREILKEQQLSELNTKIQAAIIRFKGLIASGKDNDFMRDQIQDVYNDLVQTTTSLQVLSLSGSINLTPIASMMAPISFILELALLYRLGSNARELREQTYIRYNEWFSNLIDKDIDNSLSAAVFNATSKLDESEEKLNNGILSVAVSDHDTNQAIYCLEHQIGRTDQHPFFKGKSMAEVLGETWIRLYIVVKISVVDKSGVPIFKIGGSDKFKVEQYHKVAFTSRWYGKRPRWDISVDTYDSRDIQRFRGQNHEARVQDIKNSAKWRTVIRHKLPKAVDELYKNNEARLYKKISIDVYNAIEAARVMSDMAQRSVMITEFSSVGD